MIVSMTTLTLYNFKKSTDIIPQENANQETLLTAVNSIVKLIFNGCANFQKVLQFQTFLTQFFFTKNEKSKKLCNR